MRTLAFVHLQLLFFLIPLAAPALPLPQGGDQDKPKQEQSASGVEALKAALADKDAAGKLAASLLKGSGAALSEEQAARMRGTLSAWVQKNPEEAAKLQLALASDKLTPKEKQALLDFVTTNAQAGASEQDAFENLTQLTELSRNLQEKIDVKAVLEAKGGLDKFFDGIGYKYRPGGEMDTGKPPVFGKEGKKPDFLGDKGMIKTPTVESLYGSKDDPGPSIILKFGDKTLALQARSMPDRPDSVMHAGLADISNSLDIEGKTFELRKGGETTVELHGQNYKITVSAGQVKGPGGKMRDDYIVKVVAVDKKGKEQSLTDETITVYGGDGLLARRLRKVKEDGYNSVLGDGADERKYYVSLQGGSKVGFAYWPADQVDRAYQALKEGGEVAKRDLLPSQVAFFAKSNDGQAEVFTKGSDILVQGNKKYRYVYLHGRMVLKEMTEPEIAALEAAKKKEEGGEAAEKKGEEQTQEEKGGGEPTTTDGWPAKLPGKWSKGKLAKVSAELAARGIKYRIYEFKVGQWFVLGEADKGKELAPEQMDARQLGIPKGTNLRIGVDGGALVAESSEHAFLYPIEDPLGAGEPSQVHKRVETGQQTLELTHLSVLDAALAKLGLTVPQADAVMGKVAAALKAGKFEDIQGTRVENGHRLRMGIEGAADPVLIWPLDAKEQEKMRRSGESERRKQGGDAKKPDDRLYRMNPEAKPGKASFADKTITVKLEGGEKTLYLDWAWPGGFGMYRDVEKKPETDEEKDGASWYARWAIWKPKAGKTMKDARYNSTDSSKMDFELTNLVTTPIQIDIATYGGVTYLAVEKEEQAKDLVLRKDHLHPGCYAVYLQAFDQNNKYERFLKHVIFAKGGGDPGDEGHRTEEAKK